MTHTPDEIKKGMECHARACGCDMGCPYVDECREDEGCPMIADGLALIQQLQAENAQQARCIENITDKLNAMNDEVAKLQAERDAAVKDMHEAQACLCLICKNYKLDQDGNEIGCNVFGDFPFEDSPIICGQFEWRGVQKEDSDETHH